MPALAVRYWLPSSRAGIAARRRANSGAWRLRDAVSPPARERHGPAFVGDRRSARLIAAEVRSALQTSAIARRVVVAQLALDRPRSLRTCDSPTRRARCPPAWIDKWRASDRGHAYICRVSGDRARRRCRRTGRPAADTCRPPSAGRPAPALRAAIIMPACRPSNGRDRRTGSATSADVAGDLVGERRDDGQALAARRVTAKPATWIRW